MRRVRVVAVLYWIALTMLLVGAVTLLVSDDSLDHLGQVIAGLAWPVAAVGAVLDTIRHQRREDVAEHTVEHGAAEQGTADPGEGRRLRSEA